MRNRLDIKNGAALLRVTVIKGHEQRSQVGISRAELGADLRFRIQQRRGWDRELFHGEIPGLGR